MAAPDPRTHLWRPDLAAIGLEGRVPSAAFAAPVRKSVAVPVLDLFARPGAPDLASQLLLGEGFDVLHEADGFSWGQGAGDGYVG